MVPEDGVLIQDNLLQQLDQFIGQVGRHEGLHSHRDVVGILCLAESGLHHLVDERPSVLVVFVQYAPPEVSVTSTDKVASLTLEQGVVVANLMGEKRGDRSLSGLFR